MSNFDHATRERELNQAFDTMNLTLLDGMYTTDKHRHAFRQFMTRQIFMIVKLETVPPRISEEFVQSWAADVVKTFMNAYSDSFWLGRDQGQDPKLSFALRVHVVKLIYVLATKDEVWNTLMEATDCMWPGARKEQIEQGMRMLEKARRDRLKRERRRSIATEPVSDKSEKHVSKEEQTFSGDEIDKHYEAEFEIINNNDLPTDGWAMVAE